MIIAPNITLNRGRRRIRPPTFPSYYIGVPPPAKNRDFFEKNALSLDKIRFIIGDAIVEAPRLGISFDMVFIDGDKRTYIEAYNMAFGILRKGGYIIADNTLWDGHVLEEASYS